MAEGALGKKSGAVVASAQEQDALQPRHSWQASAGTPQASIKPKDLSASSQQNRFHVADTAARNQLIDIKGVNLSIGHKDLLQETHVQLQAAHLPASFPATRSIISQQRSGVRYGLIGANGTGKSMLLRALAHRWISGMPGDVAVYYVDQMEDRGDALAAPIIESVLAADTPQARLACEVAALERAVATGDSHAMAAALLEDRRAAAARALAECTEKAARTSGQRGVAARKNVNRLEAALAACAITPDEDVDYSIQKVLEVKYTAMEPVQLRRERAEADLLRFGFKQKDFQRPAKELSGGWRIRVALAMARHAQAQVLFLDEPTNHLDLPGILSLKALIKSLEDTTLVIVSHDRAFLDDTVDDIILLANKGLWYHVGNYSAFVEATAEQRAMRAHQRDALTRKAESAQASITKEKAAAGKSGDSKKQAQMASKQRKLDERHGLEVNAKGHRFKLNRDRAGFHNTLRDDVADETDDSVAPWRLPTPPPLRAHGPLIQVEGAAYSFRCPAGPGKDVISGVTLGVDAGAKMAFVGANGEGKSTIMGLLAGLLEPTKGEDFADNVRTLHEAALDHMAAAFPDATQQDIYRQLGAYGLQGAVARQPLCTFSGGQAVRYAFARLAMKPPHVLLLDEPTNHLDLGTVAALLEALRSYAGAVVCVSHDVHFVRELVGDEVYRVVGGRVEVCGKRFLEKGR